MPFVYCFHSKFEAETYTTSGSPNTEIAPLGIIVGASATRVCGLQAINVQGKAVGRTSLSALSFRLKGWTSAAPGLGAAYDAQPVDNRAPANASRILLGGGGGTASVGNGVGGPNLIGGFGCLASEPGGWIAMDSDGNATVLPFGNYRGLSMVSSSGTPLLDYEFSGEILEL